MTTDDETPAPPNIHIGNDVSSSKIIAGDHNIIAEHVTIHVERGSPDPRLTDHPDVRRGSGDPRPPSPLFSIPAPPTNFTGRVDEITDLLAHFNNGVSISGLSGGGGVGKSALARVLVEKLADQYPDARIQLDLQGAPHSGQTPLTPVDALRRLLQSFHPTAQLPDDVSSLKAMLINTLQGKRVLFLLDNAHNDAQVRPLLPPAPSAAIVTSRTRIILTDVGIYRKELGKLPPPDARALLRKIDPSLNSADDATVDALAQQCGALPLALNVAAALLASRPDWTPAHLIELLANERTRLALLKMDDDPDLDVEASLSLSYNQLDETAQRRFRSLGIFPAPFDLPALAALWDMPPAACDQALGPFLRLSLLETRPGAMPYRLHDLTRIYAEDRLREQAEEWGIVAPRYSHHFMYIWAKEYLYEKDFNQAIQRLTQFDSVLPHIRAACQHIWQNKGEQHYNDLLKKFSQKLTDLYNEYTTYSNIKDIIYDPLTGSFDPDFQKSLMKEFAHAIRDDYDIGFMLINIDAIRKNDNQSGDITGDLAIQAVIQTVLKQTTPAKMNDNQRGDITGDLAIQAAIQAVMQAALKKTAVAKMIVSRARAAGMAFRMKDNDEFLLVMPGIVHEVGQLRAEYLCDAIRDTPIFYGEQKLSMSVSIGLATFPQNGKTWEEIYQALVQVLNYAKQNGGNRVEVA